MRSTLFVAAACALAIGSPAHAAFVVNLLESGPDVVADGLGTLDLTDLTFEAGGLTPNSLLWPAGGAVVYGDSSAAAVYSGVSGPTNFGAGPALAPDASAGDTVGVLFTGLRELEVPSGYVSGAQLSNSATFSNETLASLGATPGVYVWTWGQGAHADSFTLNVGPVATGAPEPAAWALMLGGLGALGAALRRRRFAVAGG